MEYTVVLQGSFSDADGIYCTGILFCANPAKPTNPPPAKMKIAFVFNRSRATRAFNALDWAFGEPFLRIRPA